MTSQTDVRYAELGGLMFAFDERVLAPRAWTQAQSAWARDLLDDLPSGPALELCSGLGHRVEVRVGRLETSLMPAERFALVLADPPWVPSDAVSRFPEDPVAAID